jgi:SHS2 domain-containing protein
MTSTFKFVDHTADIAVEVSGNTLEELFLAAVYGWKNSVIEPSSHDRDRNQSDLNLKENSIEELLVSFLQEFNYLFESKKIFPVEINDITIKNKNYEFSLKCKVRFAKILKDDDIKAEIKAVTFHQLDIKKLDDVYKTIIVFDI